MASKRDGDPPPVDWLLRNAPINEAVAAGSTELDVVRRCAAAMADFAGLSLGKITGAKTAPLPRGCILVGDAHQELHERGFEYSVEDGRLSIIRSPLWPSRWPPIELPPQRTEKRRGRRPFAYWTAARKFMDQYLDNNGFPEAGDGGQAKLEKLVRDFVDERTATPPSKTAIRDHVKEALLAHKRKIGADC